MGKVLVTGGGGQLGRALGARLPGSGILSRAELDVTDREAVMRAVAARQPGVIINAAAFTRVDAAEAEPDDAYRVNVVGARNLAEAAESVGALIVQVSTDYVFPGTKNEPYLEGDETGPLSVYGKTKLEGEIVTQQCSRWLLVRTSWVFGAGHNFFGSILKAASGGVSELTVVSDQVGLPTYAPHLSDGIVNLVSKGATGIFHLAGSGPSATWADLAEHALSAAGLRTPVRRISTAEFFASRTGPTAPRPANSVLNCAKAAALGVGLPDWREAVAEYARDYMDGAGP